VSKEYTLTRAGWPRPANAEGYPVPWVAPEQNLSHVNEGRQLATVSGSICGVCGGDYDYGDDAYGFTSLEDEDGNITTDLPLEPGDALVELPDMKPERDFVGFLDGAVMHHRCARLAAARCPHIRGRKDLIMVRVPANDATVRDLDGKLRPTYSVEDAIYVPWPTITLQEAA